MIFVQGIDEFVYYGSDERKGSNIPQVKHIGDTEPPQILGRKPEAAANQLLDVSMVCVVFPKGTTPGHHRDTRRYLAMTPFEATQMAKELLAAVAAVEGGNSYESRPAE